MQSYGFMPVGAHRTKFHVVFAAQLFLSADLGGYVSECLVMIRE